MKRKHILILSALLYCLLPYASVAQTEALKIGDQVPDINFPDAYNYRTTRNEPVKFSELKGKLVILDFWGTFCEPCLEGFPLLDSMQKRFGDRIQIITVNWQSKDSITNFFKLHASVFKPAVPFITGTRTLDSIFPHMGVPFQVWISPAGKVLYTADSYNLTAENIEKTLAGAVINLRKAPPEIYQETLFDKKWSNDIAYASYLVHFNYDDGLHLDGPGKGKGITDRGTIVELYQHAVDGLTRERYQFSQAGRTVVESKDSSVWFNKNHGEASVTWQEKHFFSYQLTIPEAGKDNVYKLMLQDMDRYFHWKVAIRSRNVNCLVLIRKHSTDKLKTKGGKPFNDCYPRDKREQQTGPVRYFTNEPFNELSDLIRSLMEYYFHRPFKDLTGYKNNIDFQMSAQDLDNLTLGKLKMGLNKYGLDLVKKSFRMKVLVLKDH